jgi:hypothetical protein
MGLFDKKRKELPALFSESELEPETQAAGYNEVIDYLTGLSDKDYQTVCSVAVIYREAQAKVAETLGIENEPTTFITPPEAPSNTELLPQDVNHIAPKTILDDDDEDADIAAILDEPEFLETDEKSKKSKQIEVDEK